MLFSKRAIFNYAYEFQGARRINYDWVVKIFSFLPHILVFEESSFCEYTSLWSDVLVKCDEKINALEKTNFILSIIDCYRKTKKEKHQKTHLKLSRLIQMLQTFLPFKNNFEENEK